MAVLLLLAALFTHTLTPRIANATRDTVVTVKVHVLPSDANCALAVAVDDGENYYRESDLPLMGSRDGGFHTFHYKGLPPGYYSVVIALFDCDAHERLRKIDHFTLG